MACRVGRLGSTPSPEERPVRRRWTHGAAWVTAHVRSALLPSGPESGRRSRGRGSTVRGRGRPASSTSIAMAWCPPGRDVNRFRPDGLGPLGPHPPGVEDDGTVAVRDLADPLGLDGETSAGQRTTHAPVERLLNSPTVAPVASRRPTASSYTSRGRRCRDAVAAGRCRRRRRDEVGLHRERGLQLLVDGRAERATADREVGVAEVAGTGREHLRDAVGPAVTPLGRGGVGVPTPSVKESPSATTGGSGSVTSHGARAPSAELSRPPVVTSTSPTDAGG